MYHRVAEVEVDPWELSVSPDHFCEQLDYLESQTNVWRLDDYVHALRSGSLPSRAVVITFDDGYADNLSTAAPMLRKAGLPATFFIVTGAVGQTGEFWWDDLERCLLRDSVSPIRLLDELSSVGLDLVEPGNGREEEWKALGKRSETVEAFRRALYRQIWQFAASLSPQSRSRFLDRVREASGTTVSARPTHRTLTGEELISLSRVPGMDVGAHGVTHTPLTALPLQKRRREIAESRSWLEENIDQAVETFSYPNGALDDETAMLLEEEGFSAACSTEEGLAGYGTRPLVLPRLQVPDVNGKEFERWVEEVLNYTPVFR
jgi:peptidoglycan/xylan/chitin deacetylase (PgdA/CDA1 family)